MNNNLLNFVSNFKNPQDFLKNAINNNEIMSNPMAKNAYSLYQKGDIKGLEEMARNLCKEKNIDPEQVIKQLKTTFNF